VNAQFRYRGELYLMQALPAHDAELCIHWDLQSSLALDAAGGILVAKPVTGQGLHLPDGFATVDVRFRRGGTACRTGNVNACPCCMPVTR